MCVYNIKCFFVVYCQSANWPNVFLVLLVPPKTNIKRISLGDNHYEQIMFLKYNKNFSKLITISLSFLFVSFLTCVFIK